MAEKPTKRRPLPIFDEISHDVWQTIVEITNDYGLLKDLLFPIARQRLLWRHYPFIVETLMRTVSHHVVMAACRLFDPKRDPRNASLATLLRGVASHHGNDRHVTPKQREDRAVFEREIPGRLQTIGERWKALAIHRSAYLAHRDLTKIDVLPEIKYQDIRVAIEWAQELYATYSGAYGGEAPQWRLRELETEPERFLKWGRLDNYQAHYEEHRRALKARHHPPSSTGTA